MSTTSKPRPLTECIALVTKTHTDYLGMTPLERAVMDSRRLISIPEMWDILTTYLLTGRFQDEPLFVIPMWAGGPRPTWPPMNAPGFQ